MNIPRPEYPRPRMMRDKWLNLNGEWQFETDKENKKGCSDETALDFCRKKKLADKILVPFSPESELSGVNDTSFILSAWYRRTFQIPEDWETGGRVLLHFGAVDYISSVWVNGKKAGTHIGGYTPFCFDITDLIDKKNENTVLVNAFDDTQNPLQPSGKQSMTLENEGCMYTRTTGIWQTVWLEYVPDIYIKSVFLTPDVDNSSLKIKINISESVSSETIKAVAVLGSHGTAGETNIKISGCTAEGVMPIKILSLWYTKSPVLYDIEFTFMQDKVKSYFGMRKITLKNKCMEINDRPVFQRLVLDQGYYPDGIYTAPSEEAIKKDIELALAAGFNGARMHMKIFEPLYSYWADRLGFILWGEYPNWGLDDTNPAALLSMLPEWVEAVERDYNSPAIVGWCPFNETGPGRIFRLFKAVYDITKLIDPYRPVIDSSGYFHAVTDIFDVHLYENNVEKFREFLDSLYTGEGEAFCNSRDCKDYMKYDRKMPYFVSEYGGIPWSLENGGWGYGDTPKTEEDFYENYKGLADVLLDCPNICAFCYTQLTDVMQEQNGIYYFDRSEKFDTEKLKKIISRKAEIEKEK